MGLFLLLGFPLYYLLLLSERALVAASPSDLEELEADNSVAARRAWRLTADPRPALSALALARVFVLLLLAVFGAFFLLRLPAMVRFSKEMGGGARLLWADMLAVLLAALVVSLLLWAMPKWFTRPLIYPQPARILRVLSGYIAFWRAFFSIFVKKNPIPDMPSAEGGGDSAKADEPAGLGQKRDMELLKSIVKFSDVTVKQVMQPRNKVVAIDFRSSFHQILQTVREAGFSRLPVYHEDLDNVTGILYVKDLVQHLDKADDFEWQGLIRTTVMMVPETKRASELLREFKQQKLHLAIVVDEYGGTAGLVTMEDILEEITGEIQDEFDDETEVGFRKFDDHTYLFDGQTLLNDVCRITGLTPGAFDAWRGDADTLAGLALQLSGDIPAKGAEIRWEGYQLTVISADLRRVHQLKLTLPRS